MLIRMLANADGMVNGRVTALFVGQTYDADDGGQLVQRGLARAVDGDAIPAGKAVHGPPEDKALEPATDKVFKRRGRPPKNRE